MESIVDEMGVAHARDPVPPPPYPGIPGRIEPLRCVGDYHVEAETMRNCVRSYARAALAGNVVIYRVLRPERATLSLVRDGRRGWRLGELHAVANASVGAQTRREVERWLDLWRRSPLRDGPAGHDRAPAAETLAAGLRDAPF